jgi:hypothetical protein
MHPISCYENENEFLKALRDDFAAKAMNAMLSVEAVQRGLAVKRTTNLEMSECAYQIADAMLKARK